MVEERGNLNRDSSVENARNRLRRVMEEAQAVVVGAGAGLSTSAGLVYTGERFQRYFHDFADKYGFGDMYSGGFYPFSSLEEQWGYWSRYIWINRYQESPEPVYRKLLALLRDKDYFVLTTNVDHQFQRAGFDKRRLFYTQGDFGLFQCSRPCHQKTYDNREQVLQMLQAQGYVVNEAGELSLPEGVSATMTIPTKLIPRCPRCGRPMSMNLRADDTFAEDQGWELAKKRYEDFLHSHLMRHVLFLELGVGGNTPVIIKYPFWQMTYRNPQAVYACINVEDAFVPAEIAERSICIPEDIGIVLEGVGTVL